MIRILCGLLAILAVSFDGIHGKPLEDGTAIVGIQEADDNETNLDVARQQRSPGFGLVKDYDDYSDDDFSRSRHSKLGHKHKPPHFHHKPHGCRGHGCGGYQPDYGDYYDGGHGTGHGGSFASASAGSQGFHGGHSQSNAQSASFSFGPYSASFSVAQSSSGH